ncbi:MAG: hypothetical protein IPL90_13425 [Holophagales bacterium]|nr:hypothetical protein [Holophagales bacterium]
MDDLHTAITTAEKASVTTERSERFPRSLPRRYSPFVTGVAPRSGPTPDRRSRAIAFDTA